MGDNTSTRLWSEEVKQVDPKRKPVEKIVVYEFGEKIKKYEDDVSTQ